MQNTAGEEYPSSSSVAATSTDDGGSSVEKGEEYPSSASSVAAATSTSDDDGGSSVEKWSDEPSSEAQQPKPVTVQEAIRQFEDPPEERPTTRNTGPHLSLNPKPTTGYEEAPTDERQAAAFVKGRGDRVYDHTLPNKAPQYPPHVVVPLRKESKEETESNIREPGGHRLHENYNRPPPNFTTAQPSRRRVRQKEEYFASLEQQQQQTEEKKEPSASPSSRDATSQTSSEPGGRRLPEQYHKKLVIAKGKPRVTGHPKTTRIHQPIVKKKQPPPQRKINQERLMSAQDCEGQTPQNNMYPSKRVAVDSPGDKLGAVTAEEKLARIKRQLAMAEHAVVLRTMKHHSTELQEFLKAYHGSEIMKLPTNTKATGKDKKMPHLTKTATNKTHIDKKTPPQTEYKELVAQLEEDMRAKQAMHNKLVRLLMASQKAKIATTPEEQLLKTLEADMLREQLEYDSLMEQVSEMQQNESTTTAIHTNLATAALNGLKEAYLPQPQQQQQQQQQQRHLHQVQEKAQLQTKRLVKTSGVDMAESHPFDECEPDRMLLHKVYPFPPDPLTGMHRSQIAATRDALPSQISMGQKVREKPAEAKSKGDQIPVNFRGSSKVLFPDESTSRNLSIFREKNLFAAKENDLNDAYRKSRGRIVALVPDRGLENVAVQHRNEGDRWKQILSASSSLVGSK